MGIKIIQYRVVIDPKRCVDCGISVGRCPIHACLLARVLKQNSKKETSKWQSMGIFDDNKYNYIKKLVRSCPEQALVIKKIE